MIIDNQSRWQTPRAAVLAALWVPALGLVGCAGTPPKPQVAMIKPAEPPPPPPAPLPQAPAPTPAEVASAQMIWALRGGLNVAALLCPDRTITVHYNQMLKVHRSLLDEAYATEQARFTALHGKAGQDRHSRAMTRLYNGFSSVPDRQRFCTAASRIAADVVAMPSAELAISARRALITLEPGAEQIVNSAS